MSDDKDVMAEVGKMLEGMDEASVDEVMREVEGEKVDGVFEVGDLVDAIADAPGTDGTSGYRKLRVIRLHTQSDGKIRVYTDCGMYWFSYQLKHHTGEEVEEDDVDRPDGIDGDDWVCPECGSVLAEDCTLDGWLREMHSASFGVDGVGSCGDPYMGDVLDSDYQEMDDSDWDSIYCPNCGNTGCSSFILRSEWEEENL